MWKNRCPNSQIVSDLIASLNRWSSELFEDYDDNLNEKWFDIILHHFPICFNGAQRISIFGTFLRHRFDSNLAFG